MIATAFFLTIKATKRYQGFIGTDIKFHLDLAKEYASGKNAFYSPLAIGENGGPYPPLFHLLLAISVMFGVSGYTFFIKMLQVLIYPAVIGATMFLVWKKMNIKAAAWTGIIMLAGAALFDRTVQATPQGIDMILFPLAIYFFLENKRVPYVIAMTAMIYNHGIWSLLQFAALVIYSLMNLKDKEKLVNNIFVALLSIPLILVTLFYLPGYFRSHSTTHSGQEIFALNHIAYMATYLGILITAVLVLYLAHTIYWWVRKKRFPYKLSSLEKILFLWVLCLIPLFFMIRDRLLSYIVPPLAIILSGWLIRVIRKKNISIATIVISFLMAAMYSVIGWTIFLKTAVMPFV